MRHHDAPRFRQRGEGSAAGLTGISLPDTLASSRLPGSYIVEIFSHR